MCDGNCCDVLDSEGMCYKNEKSRKLKRRREEEEGMGEEEGEMSRERVLEATGAGYRPYLRQPKMGMGWDGSGIEVRDWESVNPRLIAIVPEFGTPGNALST